MQAQQQDYASDIAAKFLDPVNMCEAITRRYCWATASGELPS
jgi:hypothetical protein